MLEKHKKLLQMVNAMGQKICCTLYFGILRNVLSRFLVETVVFF